MANDKRKLRKLRLQVQMSLDGCIAGPNGEMDWMVGLLDDEHLRVGKRRDDIFNTVL